MFIIKFLKYPNNKFSNTSSEILCQVTKPNFENSDNNKIRNGMAWNLKLTKTPPTTEMFDTKLSKEIFLIINRRLSVRDFLNDVNFC